jgi:DNA primase
VISKETIAAVRERADIVQIVGETVRLKRAGRSMKGLCPFHKEKTPSFSVNPDRGVFYCFGCKESGSAFDFLMKLEGLTFPEVVRNLADRYGVVIEDSSPQERDAEQRRRKAREQLYELNELAARFFCQQLGTGGHPLASLARQELVRRDLPLDSEDEHIRTALDGFRIGYAPYGWDGLSAYLERQGVPAEQAESIGLVSPRRRGRGNFDAFRHRVMFAVLDRTGRVVAFSGRALPEPSAEQLEQAGIEPMYRDDGAEHREPPKYINSPESPSYVKGDTVFGLYQARHSVRREGRAVLVEGNFDVLSLHGRGLDTAVAPLGTALTETQARLIRRYAPTAVVMFDGDAAGRKATAACRVPARSAELNLEVASLPSETDPDDFVRENGIEAARKLIVGSRGMLEYLIDEALGGGKAQRGSLKEKQQRIEKVLSYLAEERDPTIRSMAKSYADRISAQLVVDGRAPSDIRALENMVRRALTRGSAAEAADGPMGDDEGGPRGQSARSRPREADIGLSVLGALLDFPELCDPESSGDEELCQALADVEGDLALSIAALRQSWDEKKSLEVQHLLDLMPPAIHSFAAARLAAPEFIEVANARRELVDNTNKLRRIALKDDSAIKLDKLAQAARLGDSDVQDELLEELARRSRERHGLS